MFDWKRTKDSPSFRSPDRDVAVDAARVKLILDSIDKVKREAEAERDGLQRRLGDIISRASVTIGAASDEYLTRDKTMDDHQTALSQEIRYAEERLKRLDETVTYYQSLHAFTANALQTS